MIPKLYPADEKNYTTRGVGALKDAISCRVEEEANGVFLLTMEYPDNGVLYEHLDYDMQILAKPNARDREQPFCIVGMSKGIDGQVTIEAEHVHYQTNGIPVFPFTAASAPAAASGMVANSAVENPFTFSTTKTTVANFNVSQPTAFRQLLGGVEGSMLDTFGGGEYQFDRWNIILHTQRGQDRGVTLEYGKDIRDFEQDANISSMITGVAPFWANGDTIVTLPEKTVTVVTTSPYPRVLPLDLSGYFEEAPTVAQLRQAAQKYVSTTGMTRPKVSMTISFVPIWDTDEFASHPLYLQMKNLQSLSVFDTVTVSFSSMGVLEKSKIRRTVYDVLRGRYDEMAIGDPVTDINNTILEQQKELAVKPSVDFMQKAIDNATSLITGNSGGHIIFRPKDKPQEMLIMDTEDVATARRVWRYNLNGWGYSSTGANGPFRLAATMDGALVADFITAGTLNANLVDVVNLNADNITAGTLSSQNGATSFNLLNGIMTFISSSSRRMVLSPSGLTFWNGDEHLGSFFSSTEGLGVVRADMLAIANNDVDMATWRLDANGETATLRTTTINATNVSVENLSAGKILGRTPVWRTAVIDGGTYTFLSAL